MEYIFNPKNEEIKNVYITGVTVNELDNGNKTYAITYANGEVEDNVEYTEENALKIEERLNKQANRGIENYYKLVRKQKIGTIGRIGAGTILSVASAYVMNATAITDNSMIVAGVAGTVLLGGILLGSKRYKDSQVTLNDISAINERLEKTEVASQYLQTSPNSYLALTGDTPEEKVMRAGKIFDMLNNNVDPFSLCSRETGEGLTDSEVIKLFERSEREKKLGFTYTNGYPYSEVAKQYSKK